MSWRSWNIPILLILASGAWADSNDPSDYFRKTKTGIRYPEVPDVFELSITNARPEAHNRPVVLSAGLVDPVLERARELHVYPDFKFISDLKPKHLTDSEARAALKAYVDAVYESTPDLVAAPEIAPPLLRVDTGSKTIDQAFEYAENSWSKVTRRTAPDYGDSHLPTPYPVLVPGGRFNEHYYWDMYMGIEGALATGRVELAQMQVENFLSDLRRYGFVPNGGRDYYLSRSQPPMLSSMLREVFEATLERSPGDRTHLLQWLRKRGFPLIKAEYQDFWMNPATRYDAETGLNHHWDAMDRPREERFGADNELALGKTYRDVRAEAESGLDFTDAFQGEGTRIAGVLLNGSLAKVESDLAWMATLLDLKSEARHFRDQFEKRRKAMDRTLWNPKEGRYENYNLRTKQRVGVISADMFVPLWAGIANPTQASSVRASLSELERPDGIMASNAVQSFHQWDGVNGWAPLQFFAIRGLDRYGFGADSKRLAEKWVNGLAHAYATGHNMPERINVLNGEKPPSDGKKYEAQPDFLWSFATYEWALIRILGVKPQPLGR